MDTKWAEKLKVGDTVIIDYGGSRDAGAIVKVTKITKVHIIAGPGEIKFKKTDLTHRISDWDWWYIHEATPERVTANARTCYSY